ncbi:MULTISPECIES: hypothetical protein [Enterobacter cloacae complex]|jgi:hypothetical protein|uniref:hypothetical protein n=1 Tax=Enterobacter cloacae complex TaxID=354276 RepID=UPI000799EB9F|nr:MULTISPECIES: hypothetical protein [Enterobacter cloacae complex]CZU61556.1 Uncharacterised protein [Enterobacter hormaechei]
MSNKPASDLKFQATYSYYLEVMTETFNRRTDNLMNFLLILSGGLTSVGVQFGWLCGIFAIVFSAYRVAYKPADKAASAEAQKKRYSRLLSDVDIASDAEIARRLEELEEFDSNAPTSLYNPARNRASIELHRKIEPLTKFEKLMAFLAGGIPK